MTYIICNWLHILQSKKSITMDEALDVVELEKKRWRRRLGGWEGRIERLILR